MSLRNPRVTRTLQGVVLCAALATGAVVMSSNPPESNAQSAANAAATVGSKTTAAAKIVPASPPPDVQKHLVAKSGDTLMALFTDASISRPVAYQAITAMREVFDPRDLRPGHRITATFRPSAAHGDDAEFLGLVFEPEVDHSITVERNPDGGFSAKRIDRKLEQRVAHINGTIQSNLYGDGVKAGLPPAVLVDIIRLFSWDIDFQREIQPGDAFNVMVERSHLENGQIAEWGDLLYAEITLSGNTKRLYRFEAKRKGGGAHVDYYDEKGRSARKALLKTPIDGARLSSGYGKRRHPILGYTRMHRGVDFAAASGTPIYAAGNGTITVAGRNGGYGKYIRIRHNGQYSTAYAHMSRFARGIRHGKRVKQGQVIGYVGSTGRSTGPHLHYEVLAGSSQVNPLRLRLPSGRNLAGNELQTFQSVRVFLDRRLAKLATDTRITSR